jgi:hypothetical protein
MRHKVAVIVCPIKQSDCHKAGEVGAGAQSFVQPELWFDCSDSHLFGVKRFGCSVDRDRRNRIGYMKGNQ